MGLPGSTTSRTGARLAWGLVGFWLAFAGCSSPTETTCRSGDVRCVGAVVWRCEASGLNWAIARSCADLGQACVNGICTSRFATGSDGAVADAGGAQDSGLTDDIAAVDTAQLDTTQPDTTQPDTTQPDTTQPDTTQADTTQPDTTQPDTVQLDTVQLDSGAADTGGADPYKPGFLLYERVPNLLAKDDLNAVRWHPGGAFAVILGRQGQVLRYDAPSATAKTAPLTKVATLGVDVVSLDVASDGAFFLVIGTDKAGVGQLWRLDVDAAGQLKPAVATKLPLGLPVAVRCSAKGKWAIGTRAASGNSINYLFTWDPTTGLSAPKGFNAYGGMSGLLWVEAALPQFGGGDVVLTTHGINGSASKVWLLANGDVLDNGWKSSFGNAGRGAWRPGGGYGIVVGTSSNKVYTYNGGWVATTLPGVGTAAGPQTVAWKPDGTRALVVGRPIGPGLSGTVVELRAGLKVAYDASDWLKASIPDFDKTPWFASGNTHLFDAAWRPGGGCDEGLIVAADTGSSFSPTYGLLIRFYDSGDPSCKPGAGP